MVMQLPIPFSARVISIGTWASFKKFSLNEKFKLTFRSDLMNVLNHPNFANPNNDISQTSTVGTITWASGPTRVVQFSLRLAF